LKFTDNKLINADYWNRIKKVLILAGFFYGSWLVLIQHQKWGVWLILTAVVLLLLMGLQKLFAGRLSERQPLQPEEYKFIDKWITTPWRNRFVIAVILFSFALGIYSKFYAKFRTHEKASLVYVITGVTVLLLMVLGKLFPDRPPKHKPGPDEASKLHLS
jgi:MFS family permease